ncbi:MAG TPA: polynucleotide adenylyltransferase PcnB [Kangiella sp.]|uniref:polynucleotide adenylyltransferase PcnB n=1 Tax=Kangiella sp. TaxID=1920245 RepID=UPI002F949858
MSSIIKSVKRWFATPATETPGAGANTQIISRDQHSISRKDISDNALKVLYRLSNAGYESFLVGGGVRDILLGLHPKDFDIATNATPEQIKELFRNCRIIGRRFRLAHILFGRDVIEVATFRAHCDDNIQQAKEGMILRDNVYGDIEEDAIRRDFTINALYYNIKDFSVHDFCDGLADLRKRQLRMIGDPETRYREDPVRMLRAVRLACKLNLTIEHNTLKPVAELSHFLEQVPAARLWEEYRKLFLAGAAKLTFQKLREYGLFHALFPATDRALKHDDSPQTNATEQLVLDALENTDTRIATEQTVNPAFLMAVMLWQPLLESTEALQQKGTNFNDAFFKSMARVLNAQNQHISIPRRYALVIRDIWSMQLRLPAYHGKKAWSVFEHPRFRAAYDFLLLRSQSDPRQKELADWWTKFQEADANDRRQMLQKTGTGKKRRRRKPRNQKRQPANKNKH